MDGQIQQNLLQFLKDPPLGEVATMAKKDQRTEFGDVLHPSDTTLSSQVSSGGIRQYQEMKAEEGRECTILE